MSSPADLAPPTGPELTRRALLTGIVIGALLTPCNVYSGLKIGWSFNMSIAAALLSFAFWRLAADLTGTRPWGLLENNINQTTASASASIISGGLVAPIPALTLLTGQTLAWPLLMLWVFTVSALGIVVAMTLRESLIVREQLTFPSGTATAETVRELYGRGREAALRIRMLLGAAALSAGLKLVVDMGFGSLRWAPSLSLPAKGVLAGQGVSSISFKNLGLALDPSLLMVGFGAIIGWRAGVSLLLGAVLAWGVVAPELLARGWASPGAVDGVWFGPLVEWLLWPGVTLMVCAALTALVANLWAVWNRWNSRQKENAAPPPIRQGARTPWRIVAWAALASGALAMVMQGLLFDIPPFAAFVAVVLSLVLAVVAARVVGETGIPPIGAIGKVAQLSFGAVAPGNVTANLMGANVTGGAAGQCGDLLDDLKTGHLIGATPARQMVAQLVGVLTGSVVGSLAYLLLIPDPQTMLLTAEWPAPAVATWKAVAHVLAGGIDALPPGSLVASVIAGLVGVGLALAARQNARRWLTWLPSGAAFGLAFVIPAWIAFGLFIGAAVAEALRIWRPNWAGRFVLAAAAGLVAGESLAGIATALTQMLAAT